MSLLDKLMGFMHLNGNDGGEYFDDDEGYDDYEGEKPSRKNILSAGRDDDIYDEDEEPEPKPKFFSRSSNSKVIPMKRSRISMIKLGKVDDEYKIADDLLNSMAVVFDMGSMDYPEVQRVIDFVGGVAYSVNADLKIISNRIYIVVPQSVELIDELIEENLANTGFSTLQG